jgi:hypothetical protein
MWLGLAFLGTRLFIQRKKKRRSLKPKNNNRFLELHRMRSSKALDFLFNKKKGDR